MEYCIGCKKKHEIQLGFWWCKDPDGNFYCKDHFYCSGCQKVHERGFYISHRTINGVTGWFCEKWYRQRSKSPEQKAKNMSPEEVMSGCHYGMDRQDYGYEAKNFDHSQVHSEQVKSLGEALDTL